MLATFVFIVAMFITMVLIPPLMKSAARFSFVDMPNERKVHTAPIARVGGIAMAAGAITPIVIWVQRSTEVLAFLLAFGVILVFGVWDDRHTLSYRYKFLGQLVAICIVVFYGGIAIKFVPFHSLESIPYGASVALTIFALLGITNAINLADGLDGLAGGTTFMSIAAISVLAYLSGDGTLLILSTAIMGSIVGFLRFNTFPAQVFMGDAGSQLLGFAAGVLVILLTQKSNPALSPAMALLLLGLPILDTFIVMGQRLYEGGSPFKPDRNHLHHKLLSLGYDHYEAVVMIYAAQALLVTSGVYCRYQSDLTNLALFGGFSFATIAMFQLAARTGWRAHARYPTDQLTPLSDLIGRLKRSGVLETYPTTFIAVAVPSYAAFAILSAPAIPYDAAITVFALMCLSIVGVFLTRGRGKIGLLERLLIGTTLTAAVYYYVTALRVNSAFFTLENAFFGVLILALAISYRFSRTRQFRATPMDFLVIFAVLIVPNMVGTALVTGDIGEVAAKAVVLYYATELLISQTLDKEWLIRGVVVTVLAVFTVKALWL
ncbi:MAG: undecaprenyl/decaprenyl-phosphate alpha-N-acetylglucosaminyl 1-phosphate transferase [Gammaproteobacteria bacterium]|nr:undecaprenyl/decaprenyl-phosphate alpha-N-acetylglucosaminyl 1-phosphate transferase [Gammaproteobacteria bacterium]